MQETSLDSYDSFISQLWSYTEESIKSVDPITHQRNVARSLHNSISNFTSKSIQTTKSTIVLNTQQYTQSTNNEILQVLDQFGFAFLHNLFSGTISSSCSSQESTLTQYLHTQILLFINAGWPPTFIYSNPILWQLYTQLHHSLINSHIHSNLTPLYDILAWYVHPNPSSISRNRFVTAGGFTPHRDRQLSTPESIQNSFYQSTNACSAPKYITVWYAISHASSNNSVLTFLPKTHDDGYLNGDLMRHTNDESVTPAESSNTIELLRVTRVKSNAIESMRTFDACANDGAIFTHRTLHWGSCNGFSGLLRSKQNEVDARVAVSFTFSDETFERVYVKKENCEKNEWRIGLVAGQMLKYYERFDKMSVSDVMLLWRVFEVEMEQFEDGYVGSVREETVAALNAMRSRVKDGNEPEFMEEWVDELIMEITLDGELQKQGQFDDDFDEQEQESAEQVSSSDASADIQQNAKRTRLE